jgi:hypothetical protein
MTNYKNALILTPAPFMLAIWILAFSNSPAIVKLGVIQILFWAAIMSYGIALSITIYIKELLDK